MKQRFISELKKGLIIITVGILYYIVILNFGITIPCMFNLFTGLLCPACGITRMLSSVIKLDFAAAYGYNKALFITLPLIVGVFSAEEVKYIKTGNRRLMRGSKILLWIEISVLIIFGIVRNII